eukprot:Filipodium_phascolosomae@DN525_c0_g1_i1.p2
MSQDSSPPSTHASPSVRFRSVSVRRQSHTSHLEVVKQRQEQNVVELPGDPYWFRSTAHGIVSRNCICELMSPDVHLCLWSTSFNILSSYLTAWKWSHRKHVYINLHTCRCTKTIPFIYFQLNTTIYNP